MTWEIASANIGTVKLKMYLQEGWEPFAVTPGSSLDNLSKAWVVWLKKRKI